MPQQGDLRPIPRIHAYPASFGADLADELISTHTKARDLVLDPFVGSGTTALQALLADRDAIGIDVDPIACRITRVLTSSMNVPYFAAAADCLTGKLRDFNTALAAQPSIYQHLLPGEEFTVNSLVCRVPNQPALAYWFAPSHMAILAIVCTLVKREPKTLVRQAFEVAISSVIIRKWPNTLSYAMDIDHSRPHKPHDPDVLTVDQQFQLIERAITRVKTAVMLIQTRIASCDSSATILQGDSVSHLFALESGTVKFVLTSPPYLNAIDYPRAHKFSQWWLTPGKTPLGRPAYTGLRRVSPNDAAIDCSSVVPTLSASLSAFKDMTVYKNIAHYIKDMRMLTDQLYRVTKKGGTVVFVVADNVIAGKLFPVSAITEELLKCSGFSTVVVTPRTIKTTRRRYPFGVNGFTGTMRSEYLVTSVK